MKVKANLAKPFLKWAGGKGQLLNEIAANTPRTFNTYIEPFVGSGAVLFDILSKFPNLENVVVNDINSDLINIYNVIAQDCESLIEDLTQLSDQHNALEDEASKTELFYRLRDEYNDRDTSYDNGISVRNASLFIYLNRTCFNGLYRVNSKNKFNVPCGKYKSPKICDAENLRAVSEAIQNVTFLNGDFHDLLEYVGPDSFVYMDPPYKPITKTSAFTSYSKVAFDDAEQIRLKEFCDEINALGGLFLLSNSDPTSADPENLFFDKLYADYQIQRVMAKRNINSVGSRRNAITEIMVRNF